MRDCLPLQLSGRSLFLPHSRKKSCHLSCPKFLLGARDLRAIGQGVTNGWVYQLFKVGQNLVPNSVARMPQVAVARVLPPALLKIAQIGLELRPAHPEQRTNDLVALS